MPRVSVLTPIYNTDPAHLRACIESVLNQTFTDFEFLIVNDSPKNTELDAVVASYKDARIRYSKNKKNIGISATRNKLLDMARGEYVAIFDHDDISVPDRLERQVAVLDANPHIGVVSGWLQHFGASDYLWKTPESDLDIKIAMMYNCCIAHTATMIRKSVLDENNIRYEEYFSPAEDYRLWARLMGITHFYNIQDVMVRYRMHNHMTTVRQNDIMNNKWHEIAAELQNTYPAYYDLMKKSDSVHATRFRLRLFGFIPLVKIKNNWILLFEFIPLCKVRWS